MDYPLWKLNPAPGAIWSLHTAKLDTLGDLATRTRAEVAGLPKVGRTTIKRFDEALTERGLSWAVTV